jgi:hypothetical protein
MFPRASRECRRFTVYGLLAAAIIFSSFALTKNIDFRVYWYGGKAFIDGTRGLYGPDSGVGYPMHYRYPPVTYLVLWPLSRLPLYWAGVLWMAGAWTATVAAVVLLVRIVPLRIGPNASMWAAAYMLAYVVLAVRSGNVQPYVIAMILAALCLADSHHFSAAALLAAAITFKIWPLFFLPWFLTRRRRLVLAWLVVLLAIIWIAPLIRWTPIEYLSLLQQWFQSEYGTATSTSDLWHFPGQSLRGILLRYLASPSPWATKFPDVHFLALSPRIVVGAWIALATAVYASICSAVLRADDSKRWIWDGVSFVLLTLLEPFCPKSSMISIGPAVLIAAAAYSRGRGCRVDVRVRLARGLFVAASALSLMSAVVQVRPVLRLFLTLGVDFIAALLLLVALLLWAVLPEQHHTSDRSEIFQTTVQSSGPGPKILLRKFLVPMTDMMRRLCRLVKHTRRPSGIGIQQRFLT